MSIEGLSRALEEQASATALTAGHQAEERAAAILEEAKRESERQVSRALMDKETEKRRELELEVASCRRAARSEVLQAREQLLQRVRDRAAARLAELKAAPLRPDLGERIAAALSFLEPPVVLRDHPERLAALCQLLETHEEIRIAPLGPGETDGPILSGADGRIAIDLSPSRLLDSLWPQIAIDVLRRLEEGR